MSSNKQSRLFDWPFLLGDCIIARRESITQKCHGPVASSQFYRLVPETCQQVSKKLSISLSCNKSVEIMMISGAVKLPSVHRFCS